MSAAVRRSAGGSGFPGTPAGTRAGVGPVDVGRAADRAGSAPGAPTATKRAIFVVEQLFLAVSEELRPAGSSHETKNEAPL